MYFTSKGENGKGTLCAMWRNLCGDAAASVPIADFAKDFMLSTLTTAQAIIVDENDVGTFIDKAGALKAIITNDVVYINRKFKSPIQYQFHGFMVQCLNELPRFKDRSDSIYRRQLFIPMDKCFTGIARTYIKASRASFKKMFLETFITLKLGFHKKRYTSEELQTVYDEVSKEAAALCEYDDYVAAVTYARNHGNDFKLFNKAVATYVPTNQYPDFSARLNLVYFSTPSELLLQVDYLWNYAIAMKKANRNVWIYVDGIDEFMYSPVASDYLIGLLDKCKTLKVPMTMVVQDSAKIVSNDTAKIEFDYLLEKVEYFKLLSQGVIERRKYVDKLSIPQTLVPYITDVEPSEGIIITPSVNVAFNDRFETTENPFYQRFRTVQK